MISTRCRVIRSYFPHLTGFSQGRRLLIDLISGGAKLAAAPLNARQWEAVTVSLFSPPPDPYPQAFCTLPSFARIERPRWWPVELNDRHLRFHGKIGDCEQSSVGGVYILSTFIIYLLGILDRSALGSSLLSVCEG